MTVVKPLAVAAHQGNAVTAGQPAGGAAPFQASVQEFGPGAGPGDAQGPAAAPWDQYAEGDNHAEGGLATEGALVQARTADAEQQESGWAAHPGCAGEVTVQVRPGSAEREGCGLLEGPSSPICGGEAPPAPSGNGVVPDQAQAVRRPPSNGAGGDAAAAASGFRGVEHRDDARADNGQGALADAPGQRSQAHDGAQAVARTRDADDARRAPSTG